MKKQLLMTFLVAFSFCVNVFAQDRTVTGKVTTAEDGSGLPGVSVQVKGSTKGTTTDASGNYSLPVTSTGGTLKFTFVGFASKEAVIGNQSKIDVVLASDVQQLSEVVVTAQGIVRDKRALGYSVTTLDKKNIEDRPQADVGRVLQGKIAGVNVTSTSGVSGTGTNIHRFCSTTFCS